MAVVASILQGEKMEGEEVKICSRSSGKPVTKPGKETVSLELSLLP